MCVYLLSELLVSIARIPYIKYACGLKIWHFFKTVIFDGALPRKTFSMGEANEKQYYLECRRISK